MLRAVAFGSRLLPTRPVKDFHLQSSAHAGHTNGQVIGTSESYESSSSRDKGIASVMKNAPDAAVSDLT